MSGNMCEKTDHRNKLMTGKVLQIP